MKLKTSIVILFLAGLNTIHLNAQVARDTDNPYHLSAPIKTIISGTVSSELKNSIVSKGKDSIKFVIKDWSTFNTPSGGHSAPVMTVKLDSNRFSLTLYLDHPIYVYPGYPGSASISPNNVFKGSMSVRFISDGMPIEPGDSLAIQGLHAGFAGGVFLEEQEFTGKGVEKILCIKQILKNCKSTFFSPQLDPKNFPLSDSVASMVISTINDFHSRISSVAEKIIKAHYLPMLALDISEHIVLGKMDYQTVEVQNLLRERLTSINKIIDPTDPVLKYTGFIDGIFRERAFLQYAIEHNIPYQQAASLTLFSKDKYDALNKYFGKSPVKEQITGNYLSTILGRVGLTGEVSAAVDSYLLTTSPTSAFHKGIENYREILKNSFNKGNPAYAFALKDTNGKTIKLSDFKGKAVLIDFMFSGCPGCLQMVPALTKLEEKYNGNDKIAFISVSISPDIPGFDGWRDGIGKYNVGSSIQLNASIGNESYADGVNHPAVIKYGVRGYPQLILIDQDGLLVTNKAPRPDSDNGKALSALIDETLKANK